MEWLPENFHALKSAHCGLDNSGLLVIDANFNVVSSKERDSTVDLVTVFDAILTSRQKGEKLQCFYENLM